MDLSGKNYDTLVVDHRSAKVLQELYKIDETDLNLIKTAGYFMLPQVEKIVDNWYCWLKTQPEFEQFF